MPKQQALGLLDKKLEIVARRHGEMWIVTGETWLRGNHPTSLQY